MKRIAVFILFIVGLTQVLTAQKLISKNGHIWFYSHTPIEDIEAHNRLSVSILDPTAGTIQFSLLVKSFEFQQKLMQEHFNENYMESDTYPKASFSGKIDNLSQIRFDTDGSYPIQVTGDLTIHGVTHTITNSGTLNIKSGIVSVNAKFLVASRDYNIAIPDLVKEHIAKEIEVNVDVTYSKN
jgi:polyisoprenoid-binding protein YceI